MNLMDERIKECLQTRFIGRPLHLHRTIASTNEEARNAAASGASEGTVIAAEHQSSGRGRLGRNWSSREGANLLFSIILRPQTPPESLSVFPFLTAVAAAEALERSSNLSVHCKWPNDLLVRGRKIGGVLIESSTRDRSVEYLVLGVGINVNQVDFPPPLDASATSVVNETGSEADLAHLLCTILGSIESRYDAFLSDGPARIFRDWLDRAAWMNQHVTVNTGRISVRGTMTGLSADGGLVLETEQGRKVVYAGDTVADNQHMEKSG